MTVKYKVIKQSELGTNCWSPARFIEGERCPRVMRCNYPERRACKAVDAEIDYLIKKRAELDDRTDIEIQKLTLAKYGR